MKGKEEIKACAFTIGQTQSDCGMKSPVQDYVDQVGVRNVRTLSSSKNLFFFFYFNTLGFFNCLPSIEVDLCRWNALAPCDINIQLNLI